MPQTSEAAADSTAYEGQQATTRQAPWQVLNHLAFVFALTPLPAPITTQKPPPAEGYSARDEVRVDRGASIDDIHHDTPSTCVHDAYCTN